GQLVFSTASFIVSMKLFQRSAFLYSSASVLRGVHAFGAAATISFQALIPLSIDCLAASLAAFALLVSSEGRSSGTPLPLPTTAASWVFFRLPWPGPCPCLDS